MEETKKSEDTLDEDQRKAVFHYKGPCLVTAGPGSGKTRVLLSRILVLNERYHVPPEQILALTYTRAAAESMKRRLDQQNPALNQVTIGTFHSFFYSVLREFNPHSAFSLLTECEIQSILKSIISQYVNTKGEDADFLLLQARRLISNAKNGCKPSDKELEVLGGNDNFGKIYNRYRENCLSLRKIDFDDMLLNSKELLQRNPEILKLIHKKFTFICVDEFQDCNKIQFELLLMIEGADCNSFVVGDRNQAIYGFRGSYPGIMDKYKSEHKGCNEVLLKTNYRSVSSVVKMSGRLLSGGNPFRKQPWKSANIIDQGRHVSIEQFENSTEQATAIFSVWKKAVRKKPDKTVAVLCRTNREVDDIRRFLEKMYTQAGENTSGENLLIFPTVCTIHASKGLEYDTVIIPTVNHGNIPYGNKITGEQTEEERRLFYVGMTRAKKDLYLFYVHRNGHRKMYKSAFLRVL